MTARPPFHIRKGSAQTTFVGGYTPKQIKKAYRVDKLKYSGMGQKIALIEAFGSPTIKKDLETFDKQFNLSSAQLNISYPEGTRFQNNPDWGVETSLDVEWAHALAPNAQILLVVAKSASTKDLLTAIKYAADTLGAQVVSMSWGTTEFSGQLHDDNYFSHNGTVYCASSGYSDNPMWPAASPKVIGVGGTTLTQSGTDWTEVAWSGSGGGISSYESEPGYQIKYGVTSADRGIPDVSFDADPNTGVAIYDSTPDQGTAGWFVVGGTSLGAPAWSALIALVDQARASSLTDGHEALYQLATGATYAQDFRDITSGSNGSYSAGPGYDFVTGLGSPLANNLVPGLRSMN
jgi:subtilase family serine protease